METELGQYVQERGLCHKYLVDAKRCVEETLLNPVLQPRECFSGIQLSTHNMSPGGNCATVQHLQAFPRNETFTTTRRPIQAEVRLFTCELQCQLDDVRFAFADD